MRTGLWFGAVLLVVPGLFAASPPTAEEFIGQVTSLRAFRDSQCSIRTEVTLTGTNGATRQLTIDGGELDGVGMRNLTTGFTLFKPVVPTNTVGSISYSHVDASNRFFRVKRIY